MDQIQHIPIDQILADEQVRTHFDPAAIEGLAASLKEVGQLQPVRVRRREGGFVLVDGERRYRAAKLAGLKTLAVIVEPEQFGAAELMQRQLVANCQREDLNPVEKAQGIARLMEAGGMTAAQAAKKLGMSPPTVTRLLALLKLPAAMQEQIHRGEIAASAAYELTRVKNDDERAALAGQLSAGELTRDRLAGVRRTAARTDRSDARVTRVTAVLGGERSVAIAGPGLDLQQCIDTLEDLLGRARQARKNGVSLQTLAQVLKDQHQAAFQQEP